MSPTSFVTSWARSGSSATPSQRWVDDVSPTIPAFDAELVSHPLLGAEGVVDGKGEQVTRSVTMARTNTWNPVLLSTETHTLIRRRALRWNYLVPLCRHPLGVGIGPTDADVAQDLVFTASLARTCLVAWRLRERLRTVPAGELVAFAKARVGVNPGILPRCSLPGYRSRVHWSDRVMPSPAMGPS